MNAGNAMSRLLKQPGFCLQKVSPTTFPNDVITTHHRRGDKITEKEEKGIKELVRSGTAFRCRIGKGRYHYGSTVTDAIVGALEGKQGCR